MRVISPRSGAQGEENEMADHLDNSTSIRMDNPTSMRSMGGPAAADPAMGSSRPSSEYGQKASLTGTNSTIMHMNLSADKFMTRAMDRRQGREEKKEEGERPVPGEDADERGPVAHLSSDEDWLDELGEPMPSPAVAAHNAKTSKNKTKDSLEKERERQIALIAMAQEQTSLAQELLYLWRGRLRSAVIVVYVVGHCFGTLNISIVECDLFWSVLVQSHRYRSLSN
jgi:hypothetical protein